MLIDFWLIYLLNVFAPNFLFTDKTLTVFFVANQCKYDDKCLNNTNDKYFAISHDKKKIEKRQQQNTYTTLAPMLSQLVLFIDSIANKWHIAQCSKESLPIKAGGKNDDAQCYSMQL